MKETYEQQKRDSEMIFTQVSTGAFDDFGMAQEAVLMIYVPDMSISRSGIAHALTRLEEFYRSRGAAKQVE